MGDVMRLSVAQKLDPFWTTFAATPRFQRLPTTLPAGRRVVDPTWDVEDIVSLLEG